MHNVSQRLNLRHSAEPLRGAVGLLEAVGFKEATKVSAEVELRMLEGSEFIYLFYLFDLMTKGRSH